MKTMTASDKLKALHDAGWTGAAISKETGIPQPTISRVLARVHVHPKEPTVRAIDALFERVILPMAPANHAQTECLDMGEVTITADTPSLHAALDELKLAVSGKPELFELLLQRVNFTSELIRIDVDVSPTPGTRELRILFQPSDCFLELLSAIRAGNVDGL